MFLDSIDFQQDMQMFNNNGNSTYTFKAQYSNGFGLDRFQQHQMQDSVGVDFSVDYKDYYVGTESKHALAVFLTFVGCRTIGLIPVSILKRGGILVSMRK